MSTSLALHEAIVIALINIDRKSFAATFLETAIYIQHNYLFDEGDSKLNLAVRVKMCTTKSNGKYRYLFEQVNPTVVRLRANTTPVDEAEINSRQHELGLLRLKKPPIAWPSEGEKILRNYRIR